MDILLGLTRPRSLARRFPYTFSFPFLPRISSLSQCGTGLLTIVCPGRAVSFAGAFLIAGLQPFCCPSLEGSALLLPCPGAGCFFGIDCPFISSVLYLDHATVETGLESKKNLKPLVNLS